MNGATPNDYRVIQKVIHWLMGIFIILDLIVAQKFDGFLEEAERLESRMDHATLGASLAIVLLLRLYFRFRSGAPALPGDMAVWQTRLARTVHGLLYVAMVCLIATGALTATQATDPILLYGNFEITVGNMEEASFRRLREFHELMIGAMIGLIVIHVLAALYHQFVRRDRVLVRMLRFWRSETEPV